ncbi:Uncharacterised protein [Mycobacteroides abscessus subsp. abscessus]|nr:Uncharacterised protein [Mycobacteroides abscessus subsp. abscessus]
MKNNEKQAAGSSLIPAIQSGDLMKLLETILNNPMAHVNRIDFLSKIYGVSEDEIRNGSITISLKEKETMAKVRIHKNVIGSSSLSFVSGLPGGLAMAGTIPADILQNMIYSIRLIQELAYIYDYENIIDQDGELKIDGLVLFLGTMFSAQGAASLLRVASTNAAKYASKKIMTTALTKTLWYPFIKNISKVVASKTLTKKGLASAASKAIPVIGGIASAAPNSAKLP